MGRENRRYDGGGELAEGRGSQGGKVIYKREEMKGQEKKEEDGGRYDGKIRRKEEESVSFI